MLCTRRVCAIVVLISVTCFTLVSTAPGDAHGRKFSTFKIRECEHVVLSAKLAVRNKHFSACLVINGAPYCANPSWLCINNQCVEPGVLLPPLPGNPGGVVPPLPGNTGGVQPPAGGCVDKNAPGRRSDCPGLRHLCNNALYYPLMVDQCSQSCGFCG